MSNDIPEANDSDAQGSASPEQEQPVAGPARPAATAPTERFAQQAPTQRFDRFEPPQAPASQAPIQQPSAPQTSAPVPMRAAGLFAAPSGQPGYPHQQGPSQPAVGQSAPGQAALGQAVLGQSAHGQQGLGQPALGQPGPGQQPQTQQYQTAGQSVAPQHAPSPYSSGQPVRVQAGPQNTWQGAGLDTPLGAPAPDKRKRERARTPWLTLVAVALIAAVAASVGTGLVMRGGDNNTAKTATAAPTATQLGTSSDNSVDVPVTSSDSENPNWQQVAAAVAPSVVSIQIQTSSGSGEGSGVIVDSEGLVLTNDHVVGDATEVTVTLQDGRIYLASIVGTDPTTDLAVVKLDGAPDDLKSAVFADSDQVQVGDAVMAVGNPLGLSNTATTGIVSALNRPVSTSGTTDAQTDTVVTNAIQIDAAINPGNSGGPLFNAQGEVIGITSSIATMSDSSSTSGSIGLGFAIPSNVADMIGGQLIDNGVAEHAFLGVSLLDGQATADGVTRQGAQVQQVVSGSPAEKAGLKAGDVIVAIDGQAVSGAEALTAFVRAEASGTGVTLTIVRDGKALSTDVTLETRVDDSSTQSSQGDGSDQGQDQQQTPDQQLPQFPQWPGDSGDN